MSKFFEEGFGRPDVIELKDRISGVDLYEAKAVYHHKCWVDLFRPQPAQGILKKDNIDDAMSELYNFIESNDDCQFSIKELVDHLEKKNISPPCRKTILKNLKDKYDTDIIISSKPGRNDLICFARKQYDILSNKWYNEKSLDETEEQFRIAKQFAAIIRREIRKSVGDIDHYLNPVTMFGDLDHDIPKLLTFFIQEVILTDKKGSNKDLYKTKCSAIAHSFMTAVRPRSFLSSIHIGLAVTIHRKFGCKNLIDMLHYLGYSASYHEAQLYEASAMKFNPFTVEPNTFVQFVADNSDYNTHNLTGRNTFHFMGMISIVTPGTNIICEDDIERLQRLPTESEIERDGDIPIVKYEGIAGKGLENIKYETNNRVIDLKASFLTKANLFWLYQRFSNRDLVGYNGFIEKLTKISPFEVCEIMFHPFIYGPPSNLDTIYSTVLYFIEKAQTHGMTHCFITFDSPLYWKLVDMIEYLKMQRTQNLENLDNQITVVARLGGFHTMLAFLGAIGYIMKGSGIKEVLSLVYAENSAEVLLDGGHFSRGVRAHSLLQESLTNLIFDEITKSNELEILLEKHEQFLITFKEFINLKNDQDNSYLDFQLKDLENHQAINDFTNIFEKKLEEIESRGPTAKLWVRYFHKICILKDFYMAEKIGDWQLHLDNLQKMLPFFHSAGRLPYAKCAQTYLQHMADLKMSDRERDQFIDRGFFTARRSHKFACGIFSDQVIEQTLNRELSLKGGAFVRGASRSVVIQWLNAYVGCHRICREIEKRCNVSFDNSHQHKDADACRIKTDRENVTKFYEWFKVHNPFVPSSELKGLATGIVGDESINPQEAFEKGLEILKSLDGKPITTPLQRKNKILPLSAAFHKIDVNNSVVPIDPLLIFQRICFLKYSVEDLIRFFSFELSPIPMSICDMHFLRKTAKSALYSIFNDIPLEKIDLDSFTYIIDGGMLLHKFMWPVNNTFASIAAGYVSFIKNNYGERVTIVFDGYSSISTKSSEQDRRKQKKGCIDYQFTPEMVPQISQEVFLSSSKNKTQFIKMLLENFDRHNINWKQSEDDADLMIVETAIDQSRTDSKVAIVSEDTDVLVLLTALSPREKEIYFIKPKRGKTVVKLYSSRSLDHSPAVKSNILFIHAMSGCDTTSAFYKKGKTKLVNLVKKIQHLSTAVAIFKQPNAPIEQILEVGKKCIGGLYGMKTTNNPVSLNHLRFVQFKSIVTKKTQKSEVLLSSLPPTDDAAEFHIKRVYFQIQSWLGFQLNPLDWGWKYNGSKTGYVPIFMSKEPLPSDLQKIMFCSCSTGCGKACGCRKAGLLCTIACKHCSGNDCENCDLSGAKSLDNDDNENEVDFVQSEDVYFPGDCDLGEVTFNDMEMNDHVFDEHLVDNDDFESEEEYM